MRKLLLFVFAIVAFAACEQAPIEEQLAIRTDAPETIRVGFEDDETRIQLNEAQKTVWTKNDLVSVFYKSDANQKWEYRGETGERIASLYCVDAGSASRDMDYVVLAYPYSSDYVISTATGNIETTLPATQHYAAGSYGVGENLMVSRSEFTQFSLKSVCGWLKLQLTGNGEIVKSIKFRGNNGEQVAGLIYVDTATAEATLASEMGGTDDNNAGGNLVFDDTILTEVVLDCGEGVELGAEATPFYISLPPQTFANGFTVEIECKDYKLMTLTTEKELVIERNTIQPMASVECDATPNIPYNEIWYTNGSTTKATTPYKTDAFGANIVSNTYDAAKECWVIKFDGKVTTIGERAFYSCTSLTSVAIPNSVTTIGERAFYGCSSLTSVTISDGVTTIGNSAFCNCSSLTSVIIPDSVTSIGDLAFYGCSSLTSVIIPDSVTTIGRSTFYKCSSLTSVTIPDSVTSIGDYAFYYCSSLTSVTIPDSVTTIRDSAFYYCSSLTSVTIPNSVTTIGNNVFQGCKSLTSITIPDSVTTIGYRAFALCSNLQEFKGEFASEDGRCLIIDGVLNSFAPAGLTEYTIPDSVTTIGELAFSNCSSLTSVNIPDSVTKIGDFAFSSCSSLTSITIPDSVTEIGKYAFSGCNSLTSITIPDSVTTIGEVAFYNCKSLTSVYISDIAAWCNISFSDLQSNPLYYADNLYLNNELVIDLTIPDSVTTIVDNAFYYCSSLTSVTIGDSVTAIGRGAFYGCSSLTNVTIPDSVTKIGDYAFRYCSSLTSVTIGDSVTTIEMGAFESCSSLTSVTIGDSVTSIGDWAFRYCRSLTSVTIGDSVTKIGNDAFNGCKSLTSITIPNSVTTIGEDAFYNCESLTSVYISDIAAWCKINFGDSSENPLCYAKNLYLNNELVTDLVIPSDITEIKAYAFYGCSSITSITIPDSVTSIGRCVFYDCSSLTSITIPDSVTKIGDFAFVGCSSLTSVYCKAITPPAGGSSMFYDNASGRKIYVPMGSVEAYKSASGWSLYADAIEGYNF